MQRRMYQVLLVKTLKIQVRVAARWNPCQTGDAGSSLSAHAICNSASTPYNSAGLLDPLVARV